MATGPMSCLKEVSPTKRPPSVLKIRPGSSMLRSTLSFSACQRARLEGLGRLGDGDADHPARGAEFWRHREVQLGAIPLQEQVHWPVGTARNRIDQLLPGRHALVRSPPGRGRWP